MVEAPAPPRPIAVQLYTFRDPERFGEPGLGLDVATLSSIAEAGFLGVETVDVPGGDPVAGRRVLDDLELAVTSSHAWGDAADLDRIAALAGPIAELGSPRMILTPKPPTDSVDALRRVGDQLAAAAEVAGRHGLRLGYHNHDTEMHLLDGIPVIDRLAEQVGDAIDFQVDIFWVVVGGADPSAVIRGLGKRVVSLHVKDGIELPSTAYTDEPFVNVAVGDGVVDPAPAIDATAEAGSLEWLIVEFDHVGGPPIDAARRSLENLTSRGLGMGRPS